MKTSLLIGLSVCFLLSCKTIENQSYEVQSTYDEFEQIQRDVMKFNKIQSENTNINFIAVHQYYKKTGEHRYQIEAVYWGEDWIFIREGASLDLLIDGEKFSKTTNYIKTEVGSSYVTEYAFYPTDAEFLKRIANAKSIKVKLTGRDYYVTGEFVKTNFDNFKKFVKEFVK